MADQTPAAFRKRARIVVGASNGARIGAVESKIDRAGLRPGRECDLGSSSDLAAALREICCIGLRIKAACAQVREQVGVAIWKEGVADRVQPRLPLRISVICRA